MAQGIIMVHTGDGKGKTTAAMGMVMRCAGHEKTAAVVQFLKGSDFTSGEELFCKKYHIPFYKEGIGFSHTSTEEEQREALKRAWDIAKRLLGDTSISLVVLDEINAVLAQKHFQTEDILTAKTIIDCLEKRPKGQTVVLTGRGASDEMMQFADLVTEMKAIKHPYSKGLQAQKGIEF